MFGMGMPEIIMILAVALIFIGPKKLPELAKTLGKAMGEFRRATSDLKNSINVDAVEEIHEPQETILIEAEKTKEEDDDSPSDSDDKPDDADKNDN